MNKKVFFFLIIIAIVVVIIFCRNKRESYDYEFYLKDHDLYMNNKWHKKELLLKNIVDYSFTNLNDSTNNLIVIEANEKNQKVDDLLYGNWIKFYNINYTKYDIDLSLIYKNDFTKVKPWAIDAGDLDNDKMKDIFIGAYRATDYYEIDRRPFFFNWDGKILSKKWTGSFLSLDKLIEVSFKDIDDDGFDEVETLEQLPSGEIVPKYYKWGYFSFTRVN